MDLWIPEYPRHDAVGDLPADVTCHTFAPQAPVPSEALATEFFVPSHRTPGLDESVPRMTQLRVLQTLSAGVDWLLPIVPAGVTICDASGARDAAVAEWVVATILSSVKRLGECRDRQREHRWLPSEPGDLAGSTVMILGYGSIGHAVEARLSPFDVDIIRVARRARAGIRAVDELAQLMALADVLVVLLPLTPATRGLLDADLLGRLPPGALFVNAARGAIVDTEALLELVHARGLRAVLDVTDPEPLPAEHPLWDAPGVSITPHFAGDSPGAERRAFQLVGEQVRRYLRGERLANVVEHGY